MRYLGIALAGLLMTTSLAQATLFESEYSTAEIRARSSVPPATAEDHPMVHHLDALEEANRLGNNSDLRLFARAIGQTVSAEVRSQAQTLLASIRDFATQLRAGAMGSRLVDQVSEVDRLPLAWSALKWVRDGGETANRVANLLERGVFGLGHEDDEEDYVLLNSTEPEKAPTLVEPVATDVVTLKGAFALLAAATRPEDFKNDLSETQRFFWTTQKLPADVLAIAEQTQFPFVRGLGEDRQIGFPSAGFVFGARGVVHGGIADTSGFMNFPSWGTRPPLSTEQMEVVARMKQAEAEWALTGSDAAQKPLWPERADLEICQQWAGYVDLVNLEDTQAGDWFIRRWNGSTSRQGASGIVRAVERNEAGVDKIIVTEANRSDPDKDRGFEENGLEFDGQGKRGQPLYSKGDNVPGWLDPVKVGEEHREKTLYVFRLKDAAFEVAQAVVSAVSAAGEASEEAPRSAASTPTSHGSWEVSTPAVEGGNVAWGMASVAGVPVEEEEDEGALGRAFSLPAEGGVEDEHLSETFNVHSASTSNAGDEEEAEEVAEEAAEEVLATSDDEQ